MNRRKLTMLRYFVSAFILTPTLAAIGFGIVYIHSVQIIPSGSLFLISPVRYQTFQRDWRNNKGDIALEIEAFDYDDVILVEVKWQDDLWSTVQLTRIERSCTAAFDWFHLRCRRYSGTLPDRTPGQATLFVRHNDSEMHVDYVGIGDVFLLGGQSNSVGVADNPHFYESDHYIATVFSRRGEWLELDDKVLTDQNPINPEGIIKGSTWSVLATLILQYTDVPIAFIPTGIGGQSIDQWSANGRLYNFMIQQARLSGTKPAMLLWMQGEADARTRTPMSDYQDALNDLVYRVDRDLGIPMMVANLGAYKHSQTTDANVEQIRQAIENVWAENPLVYPGPILKDIPLQDNIHFRTDEEVDQFVQRWFESLVTAGLPPHQ